GGDREHATQLTAAKHTERGSRTDDLKGRARALRRRLGPGSLSWRTFSVCSARNARSFARRSGRELERIDTARRPALVAPGLPIASVPTGTPPGICTIDSSESSP